jgi:transposase
VFTTNTHKILFVTNETATKLERERERRVQIRNGRREKNGSKINREREKKSSQKQVRNIFVPTKLTSFFVSFLLLLLVCLIIGIRNALFNSLYFAF